MSFSSLSGWDARGRLDDFVTMLRRVWRHRAYGDFWSYMMVAEGAVDVALEPELALHDMAALAVIVTEAGGRFSSLEGADGPLGADALATNGKLHDQVLAFVGRLPEEAQRSAPQGSVHDLSAHRQRVTPQDQAPPPEDHED